MTFKQWECDLSTNFYQNTTDSTTKIQSSDPVLVWQERPVWRLQINLYLRGLGKVATLGTLDVDAMTREVLPLANEEITDIQARANAIALRLSPSATTPL